MRDVASPILAQHLVAPVAIVIVHGDFIPLGDFRSWKILALGHVQYLLQRLQGKKECWAVPTLSNDLLLYILNILDLIEHQFVVDSSAAVEFIKGDREGGKPSTCEVKVCQHSFTCVYVALGERSAARTGLFVELAWVINASHLTD